MTTIGSYREVRLITAITPTRRHHQQSALENIHEIGVTQMPIDSSTATRGPFADMAPALDEITQEVLFGQVWERPGLSKRDRSLITVATLVAQYRTNELPFHLKRALENGVTRDELVELITHLAFYAGWPPASTAVGIARQVFADADR